MIENSEPSLTIGEIPAMGAEINTADQEALRKRLPLSKDPLDQITNLLIPEPEEKPNGENIQEGSGAKDNNDGPDDRATEQRQGESPDESEREGETETDEGLHLDERDGLDINALADQLEITPEAAYGIQIPVGEGESLSIGELKDMYSKSSDWQQEFAGREQELSSREVQAATDQQDLAVLQGEIHQLLPAERIRELQERHIDKLAIESVLLQNAIPAFKDEAFFTSWRDKAQGYTKRFGFKPQDLVITDHRILVLLDHAMKLEDRLDRLAAFKPVRPGVKARKTQGLTRGPGKQSRERNRSSDLVGDVAKLLR